MNFRRPFSAHVFENDEIRIIDAEGSVVTLFPRLSDELEKDLARARAIAGADLGEETRGPDTADDLPLQPACEAAAHADAPVAR